MKCPYCEYEHGWSGEKLENIEGDLGDFYKLPVKMERENCYRRYVIQLIDFKDRTTLYACPKCSKVFIA